MTKRIDPEQADEIGEDVWDDSDETSPTEGSRNLTTEWLWEMNSVVNTMHARDDIEVHVYEHYAPVSLFTLEQVESSMGIVVPDPVRSFYRVTDGLELRWSWRDGDRLIPGGEIHMHPFGTVFGNWLDTIWGKAATDAADVIDFTWELRGVEQQASWQNEADWMTVLHMPEGMPFYQLYFHDPMSRTLLLEMDFMDYCDALIDTRGTYGWQFLATEVDFDEQPEIRAAAADARATLERVFPNVDISHLRTLED
jgi:hypothetical protein